MTLVESPPTKSNPLGEDEVNATNITALRALTGRSANGVHVRLLWAEPEGRCSVAVTNVKSAEAFQIRSAPASGRLDVLDHPYPYAAWHGVRLANHPASSEPLTRSEPEALGA